MSRPYDVADPPLPLEWLALDEGERIAAVRAAHERSGARMGLNPDAHAALHVTIENRLAEGHEAVVRAYDRLRAAGFDRHAAVHALAGVATRHLLAAIETPGAFDAETADRDYDALDPDALRAARPKPR